MNKLVKVILIAMLAFAFAACGPKEVEEDKVYTVKLHHAQLETTAMHKGSVKFKELVEAGTNGKVKIDIFPNAQLGTDTEAAEYIQTGSIQAGIIPTAKLSGFHAPIQILDLPFLFPNRESLYKTMDDPEFLEKVYKPMEAVGFKGINFWESGFKQFTADREIHAPADFTGTKFRTMESPLIIAQFKAVGSNPVPIDFAETYNALQQKIVNGQENPVVSIKNMKFYEVQSNMIISNHAYLGYAFLFGNTFWNTLPKEYQDVILEAAVEAAEYERQLSIDSEATMISEIAASGTTVTYLTEAEIAVFAEVMKPVHEQFRDVLGSDLLDLTYSLIEEYK